MPTQESKPEYRITPEEEAALGEFDTHFQDALNNNSYNFSLAADRNKWAFLSSVVGWDPLVERVRVNLVPEFYVLEKGTERVLTEAETSEYIRTTSKLTGKDLSSMETAYEEFEFWQRSHEPTSLEKRVDGTDDTSKLGDFLPDETNRTVEEEAQQDLDLEMVKDMMSQLNDKEKDVLMKRFGIQRPKMTLEEVGRDHSVTRERIRQIEVKALKKLMRPAIKRGINKDY